MQLRDNFPLVALILFALASFALPFVVSKSTLHTTKAVLVESKERVHAKDEDSKYLVFTSNGVYQNTDTLIELKWNSSDVYGLLKPGQCYDIKSNGFRVPFLSMYQNIIQATPTPCPPGKTPKPGLK